MRALCPSARVARMGSAAACAIVCWGAFAFAQSDAGVRLDWEADPHCPPPSAFVDQVHARRPRVRIDPNSSRTLVVRIAPGKDQMNGRIELHEADGTTTQRSVIGASCQEVIAALGLVTALALDPLVENGHAGGSSSGGANSSIGASTSASTAPAPSTTEPAASSEATETKRPTEPRSTSTAPPQKTEHDAAKEHPEAKYWSFGAGFDGEAVFGIAPGPVLGLPVFFEAARALGNHLGVGGGLRFERTGSTSDTDAPGADLTWTVGAADVCAVFRPGWRLRLNACARGHFGALEARGEGVSPARSATRPWADVGLALALRLRVAGPVFVEAQGFAGATLVRDRFFVEPSTTVFQTPPVTGHAGGGIGFEIW